jgi:putative FmdB family regulatory protein
MPLYPYKCERCGGMKEEIQPVGAAPLVCCGVDMQRVICAPAIKFLGSGWYVNDSQPTEVALEQEDV